MRVCYLGGPVDFDDGLGKGWREELIQFASDGKYDMAFYNPPAAFGFGKPSNDLSGFLFNVNMYALRSSGIALFRWSKKMVSVGTPIEIYETYNRIIPMVLVTDLQDSLTLRYFALKEPGRVVEILPMDATYRQIMDTLIGIAASHEKSMEEVDNG